MAKKGKRVLIKMVSTEGTGSFYTTDKNPQGGNTKKRAAGGGTPPGKLIMKKYDPKIRKHVDFKEEKIK